MSGLRRLEKGGGEVIRRKSARISALEEEKRKKACTLDNNNVSENQTQVRRTSASRKGRKRKRLEEVGLSPPQDSEDTKDEDYSIYDDESAYLSYIQEDPETRILEYILDALQRRDRYNLFAEPVNPQEVWTYYKIIKEPMDFGTIRAKLKEGNYTSLEQFEHDINLISTNAMHFNATTTVFYQEARAIQELAQKLFQSLRADPKQFQLQCMLTKRGPGRRQQNQGRDSHRMVPIPVGTPVWFGLSPRHPYVGKKGQAGLSNANSSEMRNGGNLLEAERRDTYWLSDEDKSLLSVVLDSAKILRYVSNSDYGYEESLMRFAKNLGPTAQKIAERKLAQPCGQPSRPQATPPIQTQTSMARALPVLALPAPEAPGHLHDENKGQMHHSSQYYLPNSGSNASYLHGDASAQGNARTNNLDVHNNDSANRRNMNPPSTSQLRMVADYHKRKMVVDLDQNMDLLRTSDTEARTYHPNHDSNVRLESHIRVVRDFSGPGTSSSGMKYRAMDMLGKPHPLENHQQFHQAHQLPSSTGTSNSGILSWAVNTLANTSRQENQQLQQAQLSISGSSNQSSLQEIMAGRTTYLKPSSSSLRSSSALLSSLSEASTSWKDFGSQLNTNSAANSAQTCHQLQYSQLTAEQDLQESGSFQEMLGDGTQWERSTLLREEQHLYDGNNSLESNTFMRNEQQLGEVNCQPGNSTSLRKEQLCGEPSAQWGSSTFLRKDQQLNGGNLLLENNTVFRNEQQLNGGNFLLGNGTLLRKEQQLDAEIFHLGNSSCVWKEKQIEEGNFQLGNSPVMRKDQLDEGDLINFEFGDSTFLRTEHQFDQGTSLMGKTSFLSKEPQLDRGNLTNLQMGNTIFMSKEQVLNEGTFKQGNSTLMSNGQQPDEGSFQLGSNSCMRTQNGEVDPQWWTSSFFSKDQQLGDSYNQNSTYLRKDQQLNRANYQYQVRVEQKEQQQQQQPVDVGIMPDWYSAICSTNERATSSSSTQWYPKEPIDDQSLLSLFLVDNQQPNLVLQL